MTDLQRALAEIDRMIEESERRASAANNEPNAYLRGRIYGSVMSLREARSRLSALATTTPITIRDPREGEA